MRLLLPAALCSAVLIAGPALAKDSPVRELRAFPPSIRLDDARDFQGFVIQAVMEDGSTRDVTSEIKSEIGSQARLDGPALRPVSDGTTNLKVTWQGKSLIVPVEVLKAATTPEISFRMHVVPVLTKAGCNSGRCHGAARGKDGFRLSLFGYDPEGDFFRLTEELPGRRINLARPESSLLVRKSLGEVAHTGGELFGRDSDSYRTLLEWISAGTPRDGDKVPEPVGLEILPPGGVMVGEGTTQQLTVRAKYSDGTDRDVTHLAIYLSNNDNSAKVSDAGLITAGKRGESFVMARFGTFTVGTPLIILPAGLEHQFPEVPENNKFDTLVNNRLRALKITPSELCSDEAFLRRVYIDLVGILPTRAEFETFVADRDPQKRSKLIDQLLDREEFSDLWTMKLGEQVRLRTANQVSFKALHSYHAWLKERLRKNTPLNEIVRELLSATGSTFETPPTNFYQIESNKQKLAENVAQTFLGMRIQCAQCHNHPFDQWTMNDYYGFLAFFGQIGFKQSTDPREFIIYNTGLGDTRHLVDGRVMRPKYLGGDVPDVEGHDYREVLAKWLASNDNKFFARHFANLIWAHHFGRGVVDPVDDVRVSNPPSNPELLDELARKFAESGYNLRAMVREICNSRTYQLSTLPNETNRADERNFSRQQVRRIRAEVLLDGISQVTETNNRFPRLPTGARSVQIVDGAVSNYFLDTFGRAKRETVCSCEVNVEPNLSQAFHLLNGENTNGKIATGGLIGKLQDQGWDVSKILDELYIRCLSRVPTDSERSRLVAAVEQAPDKNEVLQDLFWALLNSKEFMFNH